MRRTLAVGMATVVAALLLLAHEASADGPSPGACFGDSSHDDGYKRDAASDGKPVLGRAPSRSSTHRAGIGLLSAAFVTSGWLVLRRPDRKREPPRG